MRSERRIRRDECLVSRIGGFLAPAVDESECIRSTVASRVSFDLATALPGLVRFETAMRGCFVGCDTALILNGIDLIAADEEPLRSGYLWAEGKRGA